MDKTILIAPRMSEKAYGLSQTHNTYVFDVPKDTNKHSVARAVAAQFKVTVTKVTVANIKGKTKRTVSKRVRIGNGKQADLKKAYVTLKAGDSLPIFAAVEQAEEKAEKAAAKEKK